MKESSFEGNNAKWNPNNYTEWKKDSLHSPMLNTDKICDAFLLIFGTHLHCLPNVTFYDKVAPDS